jgi:hypothetical protein
VARVWAQQRAGLGVVTSPSRVEALAKEADWLLAQGVPVERLEAEASLMAMQPSWFSLVRHMESRPSQASTAVAGDQPAATPEQVAALRARVMRGAML